AISPLSGEVQYIIDCSLLIAEENTDDPENVLNGIAFDQLSGELLITGKRWRNIYRIRGGLQRSEIY
ncbi:MAG: glutaminyl-peptide cyclotransferase, partial [Fibrobacterota bacterium]